VVPVGSAGGGRGTVAAGSVELVRAEVAAVVYAVSGGATEGTVDDGAATTGAARVVGESDWRTRGGTTTCGGFRAK
jgi:hypothetical protein